MKRNDGNPPNHIASTISALLEWKQRVIISSWIISWLFKCSTVTGILMSKVRLSAGKLTNADEVVFGFSSQLFDIDYYLFTTDVECSSYEYVIIRRIEPLLILWYELKQTLKF